MHAHHASLFQIRLSWTMFGVPWLLLSHVGGKWADRYDRRFIVVVGLLNACVFIATYPWIRNPWLMIAFGSLEAVTAALSAPSSASLLADGAEPREQGRRQGLASTASTAALGIGSMCAAPLFAIAQWLPFTAVAVIGASATLTIPFIWRNVAGRAVTSSS
jgi:MFS family permease